MASFTETRLNPITAADGADAKIQKITDALDPFSSNRNSAGQVPYWSTGARSYIKIAGKPVAVCQDIRWTVSYAATPILTVDTPHAWDIDVGACSISGTLNNILDPTKGPEAIGLMAIMQAAIHQPMVEMQVLDALGTSLFFCRAMFTQVNGSVARGALSGISASFVGTVYQHYVSQTFIPYKSIGGLLTGAVKSLQNLASSASGGLL